MVKVKTIFEKSCAISVIVYFLYRFFLANIREEMISLYQRFTRVFLDEVFIVLSFIVICLMAVYLVFWILADDEKIKEQVEKQKTKKEEILFNK